VCEEDPNCYIISRDEILDISRRSAEALGFTLADARAAYLSGKLGLEWVGVFYLKLLSDDDPFGLPD